MRNPRSTKTSIEPRVSIDSVEKQARHIDIRWADGHRSIFHHIWLRDNCTCSACGDRSGGHRYLEVGSIPLNIYPDEVYVDLEGSLQIKWSENRHQTQYSPSWLRAHCYTGASISERQQEPVLWDGQLNRKISEWDYGRVLNEASSRLSMFEHIRKFGFAIMSGVPALTDQIEQLASIFGFIRETHYGRVFDLLSTPQQRILAQTAHAIRPHNDELFRDTIPGLFIMHCLCPSACGGGATMLVDGFMAASRLRSINKPMFDLLCRVSIPHKRFLVDAVDDVALSARWPAIELDHQGSIKAVHINERTMAPLDSDPSLTHSVYGALKKFLELVYSPGACISHRLESGQVAVLDNHRVLHARTSFDGDRHIRQCHVDRDEFFSRLRALKRRLDPDAWLLEAGRIHG